MGEVGGCSVVIAIDSLPSPSSALARFTCRYVTGPNKAGEDPSDDLRPYNLTWLYIYQGTHTTTKGYVDTININIQKGEGARTPCPFEFCQRVYAWPG